MKTVLMFLPVLFAAGELDLSVPPPPLLPVGLSSAAGDCGEVSGVSIGDVPLPVAREQLAGEPFERVIAGCVGPLPRSKSGNTFLLTVICARTHFLEANPT